MSFLTQFKSIEIKKQGFVPAHVNMHGNKSSIYDGDRLDAFREPTPSW